MSRPVRVASDVDEDIAAQIDGRAVERFWKLDMNAAVELLEADGVWESLPEHGGGRRLSCIPARKCRLAPFEPPR